MKKEYVDLYLSKAKVHGFQPSDVTTQEGQQEATRYLLVNGFIPFTAEDAKLVGDKMFYIHVERLPDELHRMVLRRSREAEVAWVFDEEHELEVNQLGPTALRGVWIRNGVIEDAKIVRTRDIKVQTTYHAQKIDQPIE